MAAGSVPHGHRHGKPRLPPAWFYVSFPDTETPPPSQTEAKKGDSAEGASDVARRGELQRACFLQPPPSALGPPQCWQGRPLQPLRFHVKYADVGGMKVSFVWNKSCQHSKKCGTERYRGGKVRAIT